MRAAATYLVLAAVAATAGLCDAATPAAPATAPPAAAATAPATKAASGFSFQDTAGQHLDVLMDGRAVARYMYAYDASPTAKREETYKPYLHFFDADGKALITKGPGGLYTHHRGIFVGWQKISYGGRSYNLWEMADGVQVHQKFLARAAEADRASITDLIAWNLKDGTPIIEEERTLAFSRRPAPTLALVDLSTKIKAVKGDLVLAGDPEHGGIQYRAADEVDKAATRYCLPKDAVDPRQDAAADWLAPSYEQNGKAVAITRVAKTDLPWAAVAYALRGQNYFVEQMSPPENPKGTQWSAYRDYARFGAYPTAPLKAGETLSLRYRFWITAGKPPTRADFQREYAACVARDAKAEAPK